MEAGHGFADMEPLGRIVGDARLVALGEATHGTREFFQLKHRMLEYLVTQKGFTVFGIEASSPDTVPVNDYVLNGVGDPGKAVAGMLFWTWNTEEVFDMVKWMRAYNEDPQHTRKLRFVGFDMQNPKASADILDKYIQKMGAAVPATTEEKAQLLDANRDAYVAKSSTEEWTWIRHQIDLIKQGESLKASGPGGSSIRDRSMAENIKWILDQQPAGTKMVVWAHNGHVTTEAMSFAPEGTMGVHLRRMFGDALRVFGFAFNSGKFQAMKMGRGLIQHTAPPAHPGSFDATLAAAGVAPVFALDLHHAPPEVQQWLDAPLEHREAGAVYDADRDSAYWMRIHPAKGFDAIFFINEMTPARARSATGGAIVPKPPPAKEAFNLDFEQGPAGQPPAGWAFPQQGNGFRATTENQACAGGLQCGHVMREKPTDTPAASLGQRIDATPYRGKTIRFRAKVRSKLTPLSSARLWMRVDLADGKGMGYFNNMSDRDPGPLADWTQLEITGPVDNDAEAVAFGLLFVGDGEAWIDDASIEVVNTP